MLNPISDQEKRVALWRAVVDETRQLREHLGLRYEILPFSVFPVAMAGLDIAQDWAAHLAKHPDSPDKCPECQEFTVRWKHWAEDEIGEP